MTAATSTPAPASSAWAAILGAPTRLVAVDGPSFPAVATEAALASAPATTWQVLCGDAGHWRCGLYSPAATSAGELDELELHSCPELFCLLDGALTLVLATADGGTRELRLRRGQPVLVSAPHGGYCPDGPHRGRALVIERDRFETTYYRRPRG